MRTLIIAFAFYLVALAALDAMTYQGQYRKAVWQEASYQANRVNVEVRNLLDRIGI